MDRTRQEAEHIARAIDSVCASPFPIRANIKAEVDALNISSRDGMYYVSVERGGVYIEKGVICSVRATELSNVTQLTIEKRAGEVEVRARQ
ncbi:MAG: hypothetical protein J7K68_01835 [Candidatus Diapherotrites archaeon]|nr:hypothetical protein [Candidatus Diapherotrites archaeon]